MLRFLRSGSKRTKLIWWLLTIITIFTFVILFGTGAQARAAPVGRDQGVRARAPGRVPLPVRAHERHRAAGAGLDRSDRAGAQRRRPAARLRPQQGALRLGAAGPARAADRPAQVQ